MASDTDRPRQAEAALKKLADEVGEIYGEFRRSEDALVGRARFERWKERTARTITRLVSPEEADRFTDTYVPLIMGQGEEVALADDIRRHLVSLTALVTEIRDHPEDVFDVNRATGDEAPALAPEEANADVDPRKVFVIHGRDSGARDALFSFLRDLDLHPIEWEELVRTTGHGSPYNGEVVKRAFREARSVIALFTPDDEARLHPDLHGTDEPEHERSVTGQPRPNVLIEAGMAFQSDPKRMIIVEIGKIRPASDFDGMNVVRISGAPADLHALARRLATAGCEVNTDGQDWLDTERFSGLEALSRRPRQEQNPNEIPKGRVLTTGRKLPSAAPQLAARLVPRGKDYLLEVVNRGGETLHQVEWKFPEEAGNWHVLTDILPEYPIDDLQPREHIRIPVSVTMGGPAMTQIVLSAKDSSGSEYSTTARLSIYG